MSRHRQPIDGIVEAGWLDEPPMPSVGDDGSEWAREQRWRDLEHHMREFAAVEGWPNVNRAVANAMGDPRR